MTSAVMGLVRPSVPFQQVAGDNAGAEQRDEDVDGDDGVVVRDREPAGFAPVQAHVGRHLGRSAATCNSNVSTTEEAGAGNQLDAQETSVRQSTGPGVGT
jgi:hypothetical protein